MSDKSDCTSDQYTLNMEIYLNETNYMIFSYSKDWNLKLNFKCQTKFTGKILNSLSGKVPQ